MQEPDSVATFLFTDIEGSTRLWEQDPERMRATLARHDAMARSTVERHHGAIVKTTGDGLHAVFADALDAVRACVDFQCSLDDDEGARSLPLHARCGLHAGVHERRDNDYFGTAVNRAARLMSAAHGGQVLLSQAVAALVRDRASDGLLLRDLGSVRLRDLATPEHVFQLVHPRLRSEFPALRSLESTPNNLPRQLTSFVGRETELSEIAGLLGETRLLTLFGMGGLGKTRLSLQVAADVMDDFPDGVWFAELAPLRDAEVVAQSVASAVGVKEEAGRPVIEALAKFVSDRRLLLILDNCEHVTHACADLATRLLRAGPQIAILASSREPLRVAGETTYRVPVLSVAAADDDAVDVGALAHSEAARLFVERATASRPAFRLGPDNAKDVAAICRRLDGIPLAIELAAARVRAMTVEAIAARLDDRFRLLTGGERTALPRQQTLRGLIDWSYDLLSEDERALLQRLSVFAGGFALEAAEAVGAARELERRDVLDGVMQLVEKSLALFESERGRYRLLETVRQYAQERLEESGDGDAARARHLAYYVALAETANPQLVGPEQGAWLARLDVERENLLAAHAYADRVDGGQTGLRLVDAVKPYWLNRGQLELGYRVTIEALARPQAHQRDRTRCTVLFDAGQLGCAMGRYADARPLLDESLAIAREIRDTSRIAKVLQPLGIASLGLGDLATARLHFEEALALARRLGNKRDVAAALNALAQFHRMDNDLGAALPLYEQAVELARELGDRESTAIGLLNLAMASIGGGATFRAPAMLLEALSIATEIGSKPAGLSVLDVSAALASERKEWRIAARFYGCAQAQALRTGLTRDPVDEAFVAPRIAEAQAVLAPAAFEEATGGGRALSYEKAMDEARAWLAGASPA